MPPVAVDDLALTDEDISVVVDVLANDTDIDGDALTVTNLTQPANGTAELEADGTVTYTPTAGYAGIDAFTYTANDGTTDSNVATVTVTVDAVERCRRCHRRPRHHRRGRAGHRRRPGQRHRRRR